MRYAMRPTHYRFEDTVEWSALIQALVELEKRGSIKMVDGVRAVTAVLCSALERAKTDATQPSP